jgi:hypothetical protein
MSGRTARLHHAQRRAMVRVTYRPLLLNTRNQTFKFDPISYSSCRNALFSWTVKSTRAISTILKTEGLIIFDVRDLADARTSIPI